MGRGAGAAVEVPAKSPCCCMQIDRRKSLLIFKKEKTLGIGRECGGGGLRRQAYFPFSIYQHFPAIIFPEKRESKVNSTIIIYRIPAFLFAYFLGNFLSFSFCLVPALFL